MNYEFLILNLKRINKGNLYSALICVNLRLIIVSVFWLSFPMVSMAQSSTAYTTLQLPYTLENLGHSSRAMALGSAFAAAEGDATCLFWNPAGLDGMGAPEISLSHQEWLSTITQESLAAALPLGKVGTFALGANYLNFGTLDGYGPTGDPTTSYHPFRASLSLGWGKTLAHNLSVGLAVRGLYDSLTSNYQTLSGFLSLGAIWRVLPFMRLGAYYNFSNADPSPALATFKLGESWAIPLFDKSTSLLLVDFSLPPNGVYLIEAGFEQPILSNFFARAGFRQELKDNQIQGFRGFTAGLGVNLVGFDLDYSYIPDGDLGYSQNLGLTYHFPIEKPKRPIPQTTPSPALTFKPPSEITAADKVVQVEVHFDLPQTENPGAPTSISPQLQQAIDKAGQKVQVNPKDAAAWVTLGNLYWQAGQAAFTLQSFEEALRLNPSNKQLKAWIDQYRNLNPTSK